MVFQRIILESRGPRPPFENASNSGLVTMAITPAMTDRLGVAFASSLPHRSLRAASRDRTDRCIRRHGEADRGSGSGAPCATTATLCLQELRVVVSDRSSGPAAAGV